MNKETAVALAKMQEKQDAQQKSINNLEDVGKEWNQLIRNAVVRTVTWLTGVIAMGVMFGWHLPENVRKSVAEWLSK